MNTRETERDRRDHRWVERRDERHRYKRQPEGIDQTEPVEIHVARVLLQTVMAALGHE